jgi:ABC-type transporter Mla MlaB component
MSLKISKKKSVYFMKGRITKSTVNLFLTYFKKKLFKKKKIVLNIDAIKQIDSIGLKALKEVIKEGVKKSKEVFIIGYGCKEIYDDMYDAETV